MRILKIAAIALLAVPGAIISSSAVAAPAVTYTDILSGPNTGGEQNGGAFLTIFGNGFGSVRGTSKVTVGAGEVARYLRWSENKIVVQLGSAASSGQIQVATPDGAAVAPDTFTVRPGNFFFVSVTGSDATGVPNDPARPFRTPNYIARDRSPAIQPGDFIVLRGGRYDIDDGSSGIAFNTFLRPDKSGSPGRPITFQGHPGEDVVIQIDSPVKFFSHGVSINEWVVADFKIEVNHCSPMEVVSIGGMPATAACTAPSTQVQAGAIRFANLDLDGKGNGMMCSGGPGDNIFIVGLSTGTKIFGLKIHDTGPQGGLTEPSHVLYLGVPQTNTEVAYAELYNIPHSRAVLQVHTDSYSNACWSRPTLDNITIRNSLIYNVAGQAMLMDGGVGNINVYNNVIHTTPTPADNRYDDVVAFRGSGGHLNARFYNNTIVANPGYGRSGALLGFGSVSEGYCPKALALFNNAFVVTDASDKFYLLNTSNCASLGFIQSGGNFWSGSAAGKPAFAGASELAGDPRFTSASTNDFTPSSIAGSISPLIDAGTTNVSISSLVNVDFLGNPRPRGNAIDVGAIEASGAPPLPKPRGLSLQKK